jgi:hypothetical protein
MMVVSRDADRSPCPGCTCLLDQFHIDPNKFGLGLSTPIQTVFRRAFDLRIIVPEELFHHRHCPSKIA